MRPSSPLTYARAKRLRHGMSAAEYRLWGALRNRALDDLKFYRQVPVGPFIADFICHARGVIVELDGPSHSDDESVFRDEQRTEYLERLGLHVHRVWNTEVYAHLTDALNGISAICLSRPNVPFDAQRWRAIRHKETSSGPR